MDYFSSALFAGVLVGLLCGLTGVLVVLRRRTFFTVALTHATFPGGVVAAILGVNIVLGAGVVGLALVGLMLALSRLRRQGTQVAAGVVLSLGYAAGMFLLSVAPPQGVKVDSFLTGSILTIAPEHLGIIAAALAVIALAYLAVGKELLFSTFDRRGFAAAGFREQLADAASLVLITLTVVSVMPAVGSILAIAMIAAPAAAANLVTRRLGLMLVISCAVGVGAAVGGLLVSRSLGFAAGGAIALTATAAFVIALGVQELRRRVLGEGASRRGLVVRRQVRA